MVGLPSIEILLDYISFKIVTGPRGIFHKLENGGEYLLLPLTPPLQH